MFPVILKVPFECFEFESKNKEKRRCVIILEIYFLLLNLKHFGRSVAHPGHGSLTDKLQVQK